MKKAYRGFWSFWFWVSFLSSLSIVLISISGEKMIPLIGSAMIISLWGWRIKFVFKDLNPKFVKIDIWISAFLILIKAGVCCFSLFYMSNVDYFGDIGTLIYHDGMLATWMGLFAYAFALSPFGVENFGLIAFLSFAFNPIRFLYLITEIRLLKRINAQENQETTCI